MLAGQGTDVNDRCHLPDSVSHHGTVRLRSLTVGLWKAYFEKRIRLAPGRGQPGHQVFPVDGFAGARVLLRRQNTRRGRDFWPGDFSADGAGGHHDLRLVADALHLTAGADGHHIKLFAFFSKPYRRGDFVAVLAEGCQRDVFLAVDGGRNWCRHDWILTAPLKAGHSMAEPSRLSRLVRPEVRQIDPTLSSVLKALHA